MTFVLLLVAAVGMACALYSAVLAFAELAADFKKERPHR